ncbi:MAG: hypothetical protein J5968_04550 [Oscillospiraceae bacterium]|nr:hypothetical protein [Oscillospiraceae bacterium]MBP1557055.1 hypothetical protein [Oscillospiraceae bacterium]MBP1578314.1 hypothetical protein [Oscillospiraceae bacterium]
MFKPKLFKTDIEPSCAYCEFGSLSQDKSAILCPKKGIVSADFSCKKFVYDPISRVPKMMPPLMQFDKSDFEL